MRRLLWMLKLLSALALISLFLLVAGGWFTLRESLPQLDGAQPLAGLRAPVTIERDENGVPVVRAENRLDAVRALGWIHAQDRFFQMDLNRRAGAGELAELAGAWAVDFDRTRRLFPGRRMAEAALRGLDADEHAVLVAYAAGVNAGLEALNRVPPEYLRPGVPLVAWKPEDSFLVALSMWYDLQDERGLLDESRQLIRNYLPEAVADFIFSQGSVWDAPVQGSGRAVRAIPVDLWRSALKEVDAGEGANAAASSFRDEEAVPGSNAWVVARGASTDGRAILANDMHLGLRVPAVYYRAGFRIAEGNRTIQVDGATLPGLPVFIVGSNRRVAWGFTNSYIDATDLILLEIHPDNSSLYRTAEGWEPFAIRRETIAVRGGEEVVHEVRDTRWGPVRAGAHQQHYAVVWLAAEPSSWNLGLRKMETATSVDEGVAVAALAGMPTQNVVLADSAGDIAWTLMGPVPVRSGFDGFFPLTVEAWGRGWKGRLPADDYPVIRNPEEGRIWTANQRILGDSKGALLGDGGYDAGYRASRIRDLLRTSPQTEISIFAIQKDIAVPMMARWRDLMVRIIASADPLRGSDLDEAIALLRSWNGDASVDSTAYPLIRDVRTSLIRQAEARLLAPLGSERSKVSLNAGIAFDEIAYALYAEAIDALAPPSAGSWHQLLLETVAEEMKRRTVDESWGVRNTLKMQHPFSMGIPLLSRWLDMRSVPLPGDSYSVRVQRPAFGSSQRMVVAPGNEEAGFYQQPGGPSGHFLSPFYRSGHEAWQNALPEPFLPGAPRHVLRLLPAAD